MPDTFASWFVVLELHVWLLCARAMQDGEEGKLVRNAIIEAMWEDNELKSKKLEGALASARKRDIALLHQQFLAVLMSYDEGLLKDDHVLAGTLDQLNFINGIIEIDMQLNTIYNLMITSCALCMD